MIYYMWGEVCPEMSRDAFNALLPRSPKADLTVFLNSEGGSLGDGIAIYELLSRFEKSTIIAVGACMSAATLILQAGKRRLATPNTYFMLHEVELENPDGSRAIEARSAILNGHVRSIFEKTMGAINYQSLLGRVFLPPIAEMYGMIDGVYEWK